MTNKEKYDKVFMDVFSIEQSMLNAKLVYTSVKKWDSVGHMAMIAGLETEFDIMMETDDIINFSSYDIGRDILKKYDVTIGS